jgi:serine/threonine protein kinase
MDTRSHSNRCPQCQAPLPDDAPQGLCPRCLLAAVAAPTETGQPAGARPTPPPLEVLAAAFPQLEILEFIGQGGMGFVFKARQPKLDRLVALKILPQSLAADPTFAERFHREARLLARLNHPGIVTVHDFGVSDAQPSTLDSPPFYYLLMEFVDGVNLRQAMQAGRFTPAQALAIVPRICEALQYAHNEGILHRDIKPENILLDAKGRVKIADFGIAKLAGDESGPIGRISRMGAPNLTQAGRTLGTPNYMAPEQLANAGDVDHRADIYSLGVVFYEMLTGELPLGRFAPPSEKSNADPRVDEVVLRALEKEKARRYASADEVRTQVETLAATPGSSGRDEAQTEPPPSTSRMRWNFWSVLGSALGACLWMPATAIASGWSGAGVALSDLTAAGVLVAALVIWSNRHRLTAFQGFMLLLGAALVASATFLLGAYWMDLPVRSSWPEGEMLSPVSLLWALLLFPLLALWGWLMHKSVQRPSDGSTANGVISRGSRGRESAPFEPGRAADDQRRLTSAAASPESRFSRTAIVGACWAPLFFFVLLSFFFVKAVPAGEYHGPAWWQYLLMFTLLPLGFAAPFGTTVLGWVAVGQIRRSAGRLHGLGLAVFDGLLYPLLALDGLVLWAVWLGLHAVVRLVGAALGQEVRGEPSTILALFVTLLVVIPLDWFIIRRVWRAVSPPRLASPGGEPAAAPPPASGLRPPASTAGLWRPCWPTMVWHAGLILLALAFFVVIVPRYVALAAALMDGTALPAAARLVFGLSALACKVWFVLLPLALFVDLGFCLLAQVIGGNRGRRVWSALFVFAAIVILGSGALALSGISRGIATAAEAPAADLPSAKRLEELTPAERTRAVSLFNDIEDFSHEFEAAFTARNLAAAQTGTRRLATLLTNFNAVVAGTDCQFPPELFTALQRLQQTLATGDWEQIRQAAGHDEQFALEFKRIGQQVAELARQTGFAGQANLGLVLERSVGTLADGTNCFLDLDTGRVLTPPPELLKLFRSPGWEQQAETIGWLRREGVDLMRVGANPGGMRWLGNYVLGRTIAKSEMASLAAVDEPRLSALLKEFRQQAEDYEHSPPTTSGHAPLWLGIPELPGTPESPYFLQVITDRRRVGLMQVLDHSSNPAGVRIRYKLVPLAKK